MRGKTFRFRGKTNFERSEVEGETKAIRAEFAALEKLIEKNSKEKSHIIDDVRVELGFVGSIE